jgi:hypothetical protein
MDYADNVGSSRHVLFLFAQMNRHAPALSISHTTYIVWTCNAVDTVDPGCSLMGPRR